MSGSGWCLGLPEFYPSHCSLQLVWTAQKRTRLVALGIRFCAYDMAARNESRRHRRTTPDAFFFSCGILVWCLLLQAQAASADSVTTGRQERLAAALAAGLPCHANPASAHPPVSAA